MECLPFSEEFLVLGGAENTRDGHCSCNVAKDTSGTYRGQNDMEHRQGAVTQTVGSESVFWDVHITLACRGDILLDRRVLQPEGTASVK